MTIDDETITRVVSEAVETYLNRGSERTISVHDVAVGAHAMADHLRPEIEALTRRAEAAEAEARGHRKEQSAIAKELALEPLIRRASRNALRIFLSAQNAPKPMRQSYAVCFVPSATNSSWSAVTTVA